MLKSLFAITASYTETLLSSQTPRYSKTPRYPAKLGISQLNGISPRQLHSLKIFAKTKTNTNKIDGKNLQAQNSARYLGATQIKLERALRLSV